MRMNETNDFSPLSPVATQDLLPALGFGEDPAVRSEATISRIWPSVPSTERPAGLEPCWPLPGYAKCSLERQPHLPDQTVVEQLAEDGDSVRHATRGSELRQRARRVWSPVTSRFRDLDKPGT